MRSVVLFLACGLLVAAPATALTVSQTRTLSGSVASSSSIGFDRLDRAGYTLQSVTLSFVTTGTGSVTLTSGGLGALGLVNAANTTTLTGDGFALSARGAGTPRGVAMLPNRTRTFGGFSTFASDTATITGNLGGYLGPGQVLFDFAIVDSALPLAAGVASTVRATDFSSLVTLDYLAAPVPEPEQWLLLLSGFAAVGLARRRATMVTA